VSELSRGNYTEAIYLFREVARSPRYVTWSTLAKLRVGDSLFFQGRHAEAVVHYEGFLAQHKGDPNTAHARYMLAMAHVEQAATDGFLSPPSHERDRAPLQNARRELETFVARHPRSRYFPAVVEKLDWVIDQQFAFNEYVADYYASREHPRAVIARLENALAAFPRRSARLETYLRLGQAHAALKETERGWVMLEKIREEFSPDGNAPEAQEAVADLERILQAQNEGALPPEGPTPEGVGGD
jgi:outer membrane assembly lipoprotein YfiO